jgi:hypothetical protein
MIEKVDEINRISDLRELDIKKLSELFQEAYTLKENYQGHQEYPETNLRNCILYS